MLIIVVCADTYHILKSYVTNPAIGNIAAGPLEAMAVRIVIANTFKVNTVDFTQNEQQ